MFKQKYLMDYNENEISLYMITTCLNIQVTRIKEVITEDKIDVFIFRQILLTSSIRNV